MTNQTNPNWKKIVRDYFNTPDQKKITAHFGAPKYNEVKREIYHAKRRPANWGDARASYIPNVLCN